MVLYQLIIHFDELKSAGLEILVKSVGAINNYKYEGWSQLVSPISPNQYILAHQNVLLADIKPPQISQYKIQIARPFAYIRSTLFAILSLNRKNPIINLHLEKPTLRDH